jgi:YesN/AraC family two-component response regulator
MEQEKPYINSDLTLTQLAEMLSISPHNLSEILNTQINQNFFDFVNQYRVEEVKKALTDPGNQHLTVLAIGFDAGFNSKTSFNTIFKKYTNMTPSEFRKHFGF